MKINGLTVLWFMIATGLIAYALQLLKRNVKSEKLLSWVWATRWGVKNSTLLARAPELKLQKRFLKRLSQNIALNIQRSSDIGPP
jgi:hypothetical protein